MDPCFSDVSWLISFPDFPAPFRIHTDLPIQRTSPIFAASLGERVQIPSYLLGFTGKYEVHIRWETASVTEIKVALNDWVDKTHQQLRTRYGGDLNEVNLRGTEGPATYLKRLAAFRLNNSPKFNYPEVQSALLEYKKINSLHDQKNKEKKGEILPLYSSKQKWNEAVAAAQEYLNHLIF